MSVPRTRDVPSGKPAGRGSLSETVRTFVTHRSIDIVPSFVRIVGCSEECHVASVGVFELVIGAVLLDRLLEIAIIVCTEQTHVIAHARGGEFIVETFDIAYLHTAEEIEDVLLCRAVSIVIVCRGAHVPTVHLKLVFLIETTLRKHRDRQ